MACRLGFSLEPCSWCAQRADCDSLPVRALARSRSMWLTRETTRRRAKPADTLPLGQLRPAAVVVGRSPSTRHRLPQAPPSGRSAAQIRSHRRKTTITHSGLPHPTPISAGCPFQTAGSRAKSQLATASSANPAAAASMLTAQGRGRDRFREMRLAEQSRSAAERAATRLSPLKVPGRATVWRGTEQHLRRAGSAVGGVANSSAVPLSADATGRHDQVGRPRPRCDPRVGFAVELSEPHCGGCAHQCFRNLK